MFAPGSVIDEKYEVESICSNSGGMGTLLFVSPIDGTSEPRIVLKYCKDDTEEVRQRFKREVRIASEFKDNSKVVQLLDSNLEHDPPYFVMKFCPSGDLMNIVDELKDEFTKQESVFGEMIDCISELHARGKFHRDIKPQNFLIDDENVIVSDFGLSVELDSSSALTRSSVYWGTPGYLPPEFQAGGFKHADATGDIFMLGKSFYVLLSGRDPIYLVGDDVPMPVFHVIERCCALDKSRRYQSLAELRQSLTAAFDVLLQRTGGLGKTKQLLSSILDRLKTENKYDSDQVSEFIEGFAILENRDKIRVAMELDDSLFRVLNQKPAAPHLETFLSGYRVVVESGEYNWSYAETISRRMKIIFDSESVPIHLRADAIELAIDAANRMNRFAAMDICRSMITQIANEELGLAVAEVMVERDHEFLRSIEPSECQSEAIRSAIPRMLER